MFPGSLAGRVLKHIYFPQTSFLRAKAPALASLMWHSILWGRSLIEKGSRWRVGSGSSVSILQDRCCPDQLLWHFSKDSNYSVKSGYWLASSLGQAGIFSSTSSVGSSWSLLAARKVLVGAGCPLCDVAIDSVLHSLWLCRSLVDSKAAVPFLSGLHLPTIGSFFYFILVCKGSLLVQEMDLLLVLFWRFSFRRNRAVHSAPLLSVEETVGWSELYLTDFQAAVAAPLLCCRQLGFGVVFRNSVGKVLVSYTSLLLGLFSSDIGEALAILLGLRLAIDMGLSTVCVESDAASVVKQMSSRVTSCYDIGLILDDILSLVVKFADLSFSSVRRSANKVTPGLAKFFLSHQPVGVRLGVFLAL
ncbi:hypothetical protein JRO89_XS09G0017400 [Xanthoceras sorbifolium]|uniref:RNase H type-1 domain-containing protein n=1 Tax=Xanthoceras sorbifolium TaxID=99658 RepID=A0ABQ8HK86_9ROSI|nr:hypothetical protein JRO89_XS09G0017400 [Xanthoceras sorbifolium]